jgi:uncharacterized protein YndB with AHSA1/START domain
MSTNTKTNKTEIVKDLEAKSIVVSRELSAPLADVWRAYTEPELLDQWWGPAPWRAETKTMNFSPGGYWLYAMVSPENERHWARMNYLAIDHHRSFAMEDAFCDEKGIVSIELPVSTGQMIFTATANGTRVDFRMTYSTEDALRKIVEMGFAEGITACLDQLEALLKQKRTRHEHG